MAKWDGALMCTGSLPCCSHVQAVPGHFGKVARFMAVILRELSGRLQSHLRQRCSVNQGRSSLNTDSSDPSLAFSTGWMSATEESFTEGMYPRNRRTAHPVSLAQTALSGLSRTGTGAGAETAVAGAGVATLGSATDSGGGITSRGILLSPSGWSGCSRRIEAVTVDENYNVR